ncbi:MAG: N-acetylneuraminate synthase family protein [Kiritimatiellaeota bacterium]|nr:N-acetylneuraminate synthase family protein [Kiritimatiellota bacterium]
MKLLKGAKDGGCDGADLFIASGYDFYHATTGFQDLDNREEWIKLSFSPDQWRALFDYADEIGLILYVTPLDFPSIELARKLKSPMVNINSDDANNPLHLERVATLGVPVTMHDINITLAEIESAVHVLRKNGCKDIIILHSTQESGEEATLYSTANLRVMDTYRAAFSGLGVQIGCVEHTTSDFLIYAVAAREPVLISKHLLDQHNDAVADNVISVDIKSLAQMVRKVRYVEASLGKGVNCLVADQQGNIDVGSAGRRKVLVAAKDLSKGHVIKSGDIIAKRPGHKGGLHPSMVYKLHGARVSNDIPKDQVVDLNMFADYQATDYKFPNLEVYRSSGHQKGA